MAQNNKIIVLNETLGQSIISDLFMMGSLIAAVGIGVWIGSSALQWIAGIMWICVTIGAASRKIMDGKRSYTIQQARDLLDKLEKEGFGQ